MFGGAVPDAITALVRAARLAARRRRRRRGRRARRGRGRRPGVRPRRSSARTSGLLDGVAAHRQRLDAVAALDQALDHDDRHRRAVGRPGPPTRWCRPRRAKVSVRLAPDAGPGDGVRALLQAHLRAHAPWGARVDVTLDDDGRRLRRRRRRARSTTRRAPRSPTLGGAAGRHGRRRVDPVHRRRSPAGFPDAAILVTGVEDPDTRAHGAEREPAPGRVRAGLRRRGRACSSGWARCRR